MKWEVEVLQAEWEEDPDISNRPSYERHDWYIRTASLLMMLGLGCEVL